MPLFSGCFSFQHIKILNLGILEIEIEKLENLEELKIERIKELENIEIEKIEELKRKTIEIENVKGIAK